MKRVDLSAFHHFGAVLMSLKSLHEHRSDTTKRLGNAIFADVWFQHFLDKTRDVSFPLSRTAAEKLHQEIKLYRENLQDEVLDEDKLKRNEKEVRFLISRFEEVFGHESARISVFSVTQKGIYDIEALIEKAEERFTEDVRKWLPNQTITDIKEAGKCLAFECSTAAAFHTLRGTEALIIKYYETLAGHAWTLSQRDWGVYIRELGNLPTPPPVAITQRLDEIRKFERNPILHPEHNVEPERALPLFEMVGGVIVLMAQEIEKLEATRVATSPTI